MNNSNTLIGLVLCIIVSSVLFFTSASGKIHTELLKEPTVSFELKGKTLEDVSKDIYRQTGYKVILHEKWKLFNVTGYYEEVTVDGFFRRALRKYNVSCVIDSKEKSVYVGFYGDKMPSKASLTGIGSPSQGKVPDLYKEQLAELNEYLADPESVDPMSGMKLTEIRALHKVQETEISDLKKRAQVGDIQSLYNDQLAELERLKRNPDTIDPLSGMKLGEIKLLADEQLAALAKQKDNLSVIVDNKTGMTLAELKQLHEHQKEEYYEVYPWASGRR